MSSNAPAIFIQTLFRSGGTYWFNKFPHQQHALPLDSWGVTSRLGTVAGEATFGKAVA